MYNVLRLTAKQVVNLITIRSRTQRPCNSVCSKYRETNMWPKNRKKKKTRTYDNQCEKTQGTKDELHKPHKKPRE